MKCQSCGEEIVEGNFCPNCGTKVNSVEKPKKSSNLFIILLAGVGLAFLIIILFAALLIYHAYFTGI